MCATCRLMSGNPVRTVIILMCLCVNVLGQTPQEGPASPPNAVTPPSADSAPRPAAQASTDNPEPQLPGSDLSLVRVAGGFGLVLSLIFLTYLAARKIAPQYFGKKPADKNLKLVESLSMGEKRSITIVEFDERRFLLGNTPGQITLLAELPGRFSITSDVQPPQAISFSPAKQKNSPEPFKSIYEAEKGTQPRVNARRIPPDIRAKMRQLRESLER